MDHNADDAFALTAKIKDAQAQIANNASSAVGGASSSSNSASSSNNNNNSSNGAQTAGGGTSANSGGTFADANPFVVAREAQRMVLGAYGEDDVARASLEQLNEISRRAAVAGMVFNGAGSNSNGNNNNSESASERLMSVAQGMLAAAAASSSSNNGSRESLTNLSREDALQRIEELARNRPSSASQRRVDLRSFGGGVGRRGGCRTGC